MKETSEQIRERKRLQRALAKESKKVNLIKNMIAVRVLLSCGCCDAILYVKDEMSFRQKFSDLGLTSSGRITDDLGNEVTSIDTFYGYSLEDEQPKKYGPNGLLRLVKRMNRFTFT